MKTCISVEEKQLVRHQHMSIRKLHFILREVGQPGKAARLPCITRVDLLFRVNSLLVISPIWDRDWLDNTYCSVICEVARKPNSYCERKAWWTRSLSE